MKKIINVFLVCLFAIGCSSPFYSTWVSATNGLVGTPFESHFWPPRCLPDCLHQYWSPSNKNAAFDKVLDEEAGEKRYYITWLMDCRYSILVSKEGIIKSWRYEAEDKRSCFVF
jgi:hypothetical protein